MVQEIDRLRRQPGPASYPTPARVPSRFSKEVLLPRLTEEMESG